MLQQGAYTFLNRITFKKACGKPLIDKYLFQCPSTLGLRQFSKLGVGRPLSGEATQPHTLGFLPEQQGLNAVDQQRPKGHELCDRLSKLPAILTSQKSPAPSAVRKENRVSLRTRNPAGSQNLNIFNCCRGLHMDGDSRIKNSTPSLRPSTKLYGFFSAFLPHHTIRDKSLSPVPGDILSLPQLCLRTITYLPPTRLSAPRWQGLFLNLLL